LSHAFGVYPVPNSVNSTLIPSNTESDLEEIACY